MKNEIISNVSIDGIEENGTAHRKSSYFNMSISRQLLSESMSAELPWGSIDLRAETHSTLPRQSPLLGYSFMVIAVLGITINHLSAKIAFFRNPDLTNYDGILFLGIAVTPIYLVAAKMAGISISWRQFRPKAILLIALSIWCSLGVNFCMLWGISMISVGKSTLIFDLSPLFCIILAFILLAEKIDYVTVFSAVGSFCGIYFLTLNQANEEEQEDKSLLLGVFLVFLGAWGQAAIMILVRMINIYQVHYLFRPVYIGITLLSFGVLVHLFFPSKMQFPNYEFLDVVFLYGSGLGWALCIGPLSLAFRYQSASRLAPINYIENVFTLLSDVFIFKYTFVSTDYIGIALIAIWLIIPAVLKIINEKK